MTDPVSPLTPPSPRRRSRRWILLLILVGLGLGGLGGWRLWDDQQRQEALKLARKGDFARAAPRLEGILAARPDDAEVIAALARGRLQAGQFEAVRPLLDRWCRLRPDDPEPFRVRLDLLRKERPAEALPDALRLVALEPDSADTRFRAAGLCFETGDFEQAERLCREGLDLEPGRRDARRLLANVLRARDQIPEAAALLDALLKEKADDPAVMLARAVLYLDERTPHEAIPLLEGVLRIDPTRQRTGRYQLALALEQAGRPADARRVQEEMHRMQEAEVLRDALDSQPDNPEVQVRAARAWLVNGQTGPALDLLGRLLEQHPDHAGAHLALAEYYDRIGEAGRAADHRRQAGKE